MLVVVGLCTLVSKVARLAGKVVAPHGHILLESFGAQPPVSCDETLGGREEGTKLGLLLSPCGYAGQGIPHCFVSVKGLPPHVFRQVNYYLHMRVSCHCRLHHNQPA